MYNLYNNNSTSNEPVFNDLPKTFRKLEEVNSNNNYKWHNDTGTAHNAKTFHLSVSSTLPQEKHRETYSTSPFSQKRLNETNLTSRSDSVFMSPQQNKPIFLSQKSSEILETMKKKNLKVGGELLDRLRASSRNVNNFENVLRNEKSQPLHFLSLTRLSDHSVGQNSFKPKTHGLIPGQNFETGEVQLVPIGVQNVETSMSELMAPENTAEARISRSRSLARKQSPVVNRTSSLNRSTWRDNDVMNVSPLLQKSGEQQCNTKRFLKEVTSSCEHEPWYQHNLSRDSAIHYLNDKPCGTFVIRKSSTHPGLFSLVLKISNTFGDGAFTKHFLIKSSSTGVKLRGYSNESEFENLKALVEFYQRNVTVLPCLLGSNLNVAKNFRIFHMKTMPTELISDLTALKRAFDICISNGTNIFPILSDVQVQSNGLLIAPTEKTSYLKNYYSISDISFCCADPLLRKFPCKNQENNFLLFGFVTRGPSLQKEECHIFGSQDFDTVSDFVNLVTKLKELPGNHDRKF